MPDYSKSIIYKIFNDTDTYVGSTTRTLSRRVIGHKTSLKRFQSGKSRNSCASYSILKTDYKSEIIEHFPCSNVDELRDREAFWIGKIDCVNQDNPGAVKRAGGKAAYEKLRYQNNKDRDKAIQKLWREKNKDKVKAYSQKKVMCNVCGKITGVKVKARHQRSKRCATHLENEVQAVMNDILNQLCE